MVVPRKPDRGVIGRVSWSVGSLGVEVGRRQDEHGCPRRTRDPRGSFESLGPLGYAAPVRLPTQPSTGAAAVLLSAAVLLAFWPVLGNDFVNYDDEKYVTRNSRVQDGLTPSTLKWAWTTGEAANWHPLTWMSHALDWELFGENAVGHHATSLLLHLANTLLLFGLLHRLTGATVASAAAAALFGVHPLHVESVAWIAERKDVLSTLFWLAATWAYVVWARTSRPSGYGLAVVFLESGSAPSPCSSRCPSPCCCSTTGRSGGGPNGGRGLS